MSEYRRRFSNEEKRQKLANFNSVYYDGDPNNWKVSRLPNWMEFYGSQLNKELHKNFPKYYKQFKQGTIVMIDYGVPIGNELGGKHFGVILSNNDTKYKRKVMVIPLSSHYHKGYVDLGYDLMIGIIELTQNRLNELNKYIKDLTEKLQQFDKTHGKRSFTFSSNEVKLMRAQNIDLSLIKSTTFDIRKRNPKYESLIQKLKSIDSWKASPTIFNYVSYFETIFDFQDDVFKKMDKTNYTATELMSLLKKLKKYNKQSFAMVSDIKTVSKLRVVKLSHFTISGNTHISSNALIKIKNAIIKSIE